MAKVQSPVAAGIFAAMAVVSGAVAIWSGIVLFRGEPAEPVLQHLPAGCQTLVVSGQPGEAAALWQTLAAHPGLPGAWTETIAAWAADAKALAALPELDAQRPAGVCRKDGRTTAVLPGTAQTAARWLIRDAPQGAASTAQQPVDEGVRLAWSPTAADQPLAEVMRDVERQSAQKDEAVREAMERVGGGSEHHFAGPAELAAWARAQPGWSDLLGFGRWAAVSLRRDDGGIRLHGHLGMAEAGAAWLKPKLDVVQPLDLSPFVSPAVRALAVVRVHPTGIAQAAGLPIVGALDHWSQQWLHKPLTDVLAGSSGQLMLQVLDGPVRDGQPPWFVLVHLNGRDFAIHARDEALKATAVELVSKAAAKPGSDDRQRLLQQTSGVWLAAGAKLGDMQGPLQIDGLWLDTGVVVELRLPPK